MRLQTLKAKQFDSGTAINYNTYDNLVGFLNHVLNTSTSNAAYQTWVDINDIGKIKISDATGNITIPPGTLLINNVYKDPTSAVRSLVPKVYNTEISFNLSSFFSRFSPTQKGRLPFADNELINKNFSSESVWSIEQSLKKLLAEAQVLYTTKTTVGSTPAIISGEERTKAINAINVLKQRFLEPLYYQIPDVEKFLTSPFTASDAVSSLVGNFTEFAAISFSDQDYINGSLKINVTIRNYIKGYGTVNYEIEDKTHEITITKALGQKLLPS